MGRVSLALLVEDEELAELGRREVTQCSSYS